LITTLSNRNAEWLGVVNIGLPNYSDIFKITIGCGSFRLQPGYESMRRMILPDNTNLIVYCKVENSIDNNITFSICSKEQPIFNCTSQKCISVVKDMFKTLNITTKKNGLAMNSSGLQSQMY